MALAKNPRFCGVELLPWGVNAYKGTVGGYSVVLVESRGRWSAEAMVFPVGPDSIDSGLPVASPELALERLYMELQRVHRACAQVLQGGE